MQLPAWTVDTCYCIPRTFPVLACTFSVFDVRFTCRKYDSSKNCNAKTFNISDNITNR